MPQEDASAWRGRSIQRTRTLLRRERRAPRRLAPPANANNTGGSGTRRLTLPPVARPHGRTNFGRARLSPARRSGGLRTTRPTSLRKHHRVIRQEQRPVKAPRPARRVRVEEHRHPAGMVEVRHHRHPVRHRAQHLGILHAVAVPRLAGEQHPGIHLQVPEEPQHRLRRDERIPRSNPTIPPETVGR